MKTTVIMPEQRFTYIPFFEVNFRSKEIMS